MRLVLMVKEEGRHAASIGDTQPEIIGGGP
jgi:hypothetical protein